MQGVVTGVTKQYVTQVRDQLQAMRTAELSLQKVRKNRAAEASADGAKPLSDVDKVNAQLFLDVQVRPCGYMMMFIHCLLKCPAKATIMASPEAYLQFVLPSVSSMEVWVACVHACSLHRVR